MPTPTGRYSTHGRPLYDWPEGGVYSERTVTFPINGTWYTFPSVDAQGNVQPEDQVRQYVLKHGPIDPITGEKFPSFPSLQAAENYAQWRSSTLMPPKNYRGEDLISPERNVPQNMPKIMPQQKSSGYGGENQMYYGTEDSISPQRAWPMERYKVPSWMPYGQVPPFGEPNLVGSGKMDPGTDLAQRAFQDPDLFKYLGTSGFGNMAQNYASSPDETMAELFSGLGSALGKLKKGRRKTTGLGAMLGRYGGGKQMGLPSNRTMNPAESQRRTVDARAFDVQDEAQRQMVRMMFQDATGRPWPF